MSVLLVMHVIAYKTYVTNYLCDFPLCESTNGLFTSDRQKLPVWKQPKRERKNSTGQFLGSYVRTTHLVQ